MSNEQLLEKLSKNMQDYHEISQKLKELDASQSIIKKENLTILQQLNLKTYSTDSLRISIEEHNKKIGVDEEKLAIIIGTGHLEHLKRVPVDAVLSGIKDKSIPESAKDCFITMKQPPFTKVISLKDSKEKVNLSD